MPRPPDRPRPLHRSRPAPAGARPRMPVPPQNRFTFIIGAPPPPPMSSKGWWIGMAVAAAVVYYGTYSFLPFK